MNRLRKVISLILILTVMVTVTIVGGAMTHTSAAGTGAGLAEHALNAYYSGWSYVYGGASVGAVDCSGLIYMYSGCGSRSDMMGSSPETGSTAYGIPNIHGLGLYQPGHVGVYVGNGMAVDARSEGYGVCYQSVYSKSWTNWFKVAGVSYPTNGWEYFNGNYYYYENGEYLTDTYITVDGISYYLDSSGASSSTPGDTNSVADSNNSSSESQYLKVGSYGDKVTELQLRLTELGFYAGDVTGYYGEQTEAAYKRFQKAAGLYPDGIAGENELEILYSSSAPSGSIAEVGTNDTDTDDTTDTDDNTQESGEISYSNGDYHDDIYGIQTELANLGYFNDDATGYFGDMTQDAVSKFQSANNLTVTGIVDEATYTVLFSSQALENPDRDADNDRKVVYNPNSTEEATENTTEGVTENTTEENSSVISPTEATDIVLKSAQLASKALEGVNLEVKETSSNNGSFIAWLIIMVVFMSGAFWIVFSTEKKKKKARLERIKARANRNW